MNDKKYKLTYLPLFQNDLLNAVDYISNVLKNPVAANNLIDEIENAIKKRLQAPEAFESYQSAIERKHIYYRIYVGNYTIFYVVNNDVMEIRRLIYGKRDLSNLI